MNKGFTLIEVLVATFIIGVLSTVILLNFRTGQDQASLTRSAAAFETEIRKAQNLAVASSELGGSIPCGYGLHYIDNRTYSLYAGIADAANCQASNHNFQPGTDSVYQNLKIIEQRAVFKNSFSDIFFEPPDPATYINNSRAAGASTVIELCLETDLTVCRNLTVDTAGRIVIQ
ncbi:MAG: type II secretion system protein [Parcubacteria group bacterium]|nr:type II secretion system protein [Parcubacteria group bacterium]